ncbi:MAG: chorismate mutase [Actinobacteria bacterium]|nr:chorismate mutase [Actinomycetota bacterium]MCL5445881.1 chorismate mutase [Actinomycetota bacterium]
MQLYVRAIRGATTVDEDTREQVTKHTQELLAAILEANDLEIGDLISVLFTATSDITSMFPATAGRSMGLSGVPLLCARELDIEGSLPLCIRVMIHVYTSRAMMDIKHIYLEGATVLREDI